MAQIQTVLFSTFDHAGTTENATESGTENELRGVEKSVEKIIRVMKENPQITVKELTVLVGLSRRGVEKNIKNLQVKGLLRRVGPDKGGHWEVIDNDLNK